ncbi:hypothetical protein DEJ49_33570 [Streptomyces venezuelae]|uniref:Lsr2 family protein n=1 Tax=Streptomyces venezuelae TaxID=54571 RepID=A0A5P2CSK3_STRVZ|nr:Lsr2 family protein [Streptomyces venezuelae]QES45270.1 hypothetical protein DEJ49_33570 [Streptomyces venezuelae]
MAQKVVRTLIDDLTGEESEEIATHTFAVDGVGYEIDLTPESLDTFFEALRPFMNKGRKTGRVKNGSKARKAANSGEDTAAIRTWARDNGFEVNDRGRVPAPIREAYEKANS